MRRIPALALLAAVLALAGCGGTSHRTSHGTKTAAKSPGASIGGRFCSGLTDTCQAIAQRPTLTLESSRGRIPDVSSFQGHPDWAAAKRAGIAGGIFKAGEFTIDPDAAFNAHALAALHLWHAAYWFVRNTGCSHEAVQIIAAAHAFGVRVVVNDLERPEAAGYAACLVPAERKAGLTPVDYTAPGTWPGGPGFGGAPLWQAEYGPTLHPFWHPVIAWQCTDGLVGCVTFVPGIGVDDVSINLGITRLGAAPAPKPKPKLLCFGPHAQLHNKTCERVRPEVASWSRARDSSARVLHWIDGILKGYHCVKPYRRGVCVRGGRIDATMRQRDGFFAARVVAALKEFG